MKKSLQLRRERNGFTCIERLEARIAPATFTVTTTNDSGAGSLRKAMQDANASPGSDEIDFNIAPGGLQRIDVASPLPQITDRVFIHGSTQPGIPFNSPGIQIDGAGAGNANGFDVVAGDSTIEGFVITHFHRMGVFIHEKGNDVVDNCCIGIDHNGETAAPNKLGGVAILDVANNTVEYSVVSGNGRFGVIITGTHAMDNTVQFVQIGLDRPGTKAVPNEGPGVIIQSGASMNLVDTCFIAGNLGDGILINGFDSVQPHDNVVTRSRIGTDLSGGAAVPNMRDGIFIGDAFSNTIGGQKAGMDGGNLISGNKENGVEIVRPTHLDGFHGDAEGACVGVDLREKRLGKRIVRQRDHSDAPCRRHDLPDQLKALAGDLRRRRRKTRDVAAGLGEACDQSRRDRIAGGCHDDRDIVRRLLDCCDGGSFRSDDHVAVELREFRRQCRQRVGAPLRGAIFEADIALLDVAEIAQPLREQAPERLAVADEKNAHARYARLLREATDWHRKDRSERGKEFTPSHRVALNPRHWRSACAAASPRAR